MTAAVRRSMPTRLVAAAVILALTGAGGIAWAYWRASGNGIGSAPTGTAVAVTLSPGIATLDLYPGGQTNVTVTVSNPNATALIMHSIALDTTQGLNGFVVDAAHFTCTMSALIFTAQNNAGAGWSVPAKIGATNGSLVITLPDALQMSFDAVNACQGAQFTVFLLAGS